MCQSVCVNTSLPSNDNFSWNCGAEGHTDDQGVLALRARQMKNLHLALMLSQGTPMVLAGRLVWVNWMLDA